MSNQFYRGDTVPVIAPVATAQAVAVGDFCALSSGNVIRPEDVVYGSTVSAPSAPTVSDGGVNIGTGLTNAATGVKVSYNFPWGEGTLSAAGSGTPTANAALKVAAIALPTNGISINYYVETAAASGTYKLAAVGYGQAMYLTTYGGGRTPPTAVAQTALEATQYAFAQAFLGVSGQRKDANVAHVPANGQDNVIRVESGGVYKSGCASATFAVGDLVGMAKQSGSLLESQKVVAVGHESLAIGRVVQAGTSVTSVLVEILSAKAPLARQV